MHYALLRRAALLSGLLGLGHAALAQGNYLNEALLYSRQGPTGTARTLGLGGAGASLGGDYGATAINPAGLGLYTRSEFTFTPVIASYDATATPLANNSVGGSALNQQSSRLQVANLGLVFTTRRADNDRGSDWRGGAFALGITRLADFNYNYAYRNQVSDNVSFYQLLREPEGVPSTSITSAAYQQAITFIDGQYNNGLVDLDGLAYNNFLTNIRPVTQGGQQYGQLYIVHPRTGTVQQDGTVKSQGSLSQFDVAYGGSYRDRLYIGGGVGIVRLNRTLDTYFAESQAGVQNFNYDDYLQTTGTGINARLGVIVRPTDLVRFGLSAQTPTWIALNEVYNTTLTVNPSYVMGNYSNVLSTDPGSYDYSVRLPFRASGSATVLLSKYGFLTGDVEYVNYKATRFTPNSNDNSGQLEANNQSIAAYYQNAFNFKVGLEGRFNIFRARLGYAYYGSPYAYTNYDGAQNYFSGGVGVRTKSFFLDLTEQYLPGKGQYTPYNLVAGNNPVSNITNNRNSVSLTGGLLF